LYSSSISSIANSSSLSSSSSSAPILLGAKHAAAIVAAVATKAVLRSLDCGLLRKKVQLLAIASIEMK
jgi:hypothetical protein